MEIIAVQSCADCGLERNFTEISKDTVRFIIASCAQCKGRVHKLLSGPKDFFEQLDAAVADLNSTITSCAEKKKLEPWETDPNAWRGNS